MKIHNKVNIYILTGLICSVCTCILYYILININVIPSYLFDYFLMFGIGIAAVIGGPVLGLCVVGFVPLLTFIVSIVLSSGSGLVSFLWYTDLEFMIEGVALALLVGIFSKKFVESFRKNIVISIIAGIIIVLLRLIIEGALVIGIQGGWLECLMFGYVAEFFSGLFSDFLTILVHIVCVTGVCIICYGILKLLPRSFQDTYCGTSKLSIK